MRLLPIDLALANLKGEIPEDERGFLPREEALEWIKELSDRDFGTDISSWERWVEEQHQRLPSTEESG